MPEPIDMAYWRLHYHAVWATHRRTPWLTGEAVRIVEAGIRTKVRQLGGITHAVGVMPDHVHVAASLPPGIALSDAIGQAKGLSPSLSGNGARTWPRQASGGRDRSGLPRLVKRRCRNCSITAIIRKHATGSECSLPVWSGRTRFGQPGDRQRRLPWLPVPPMAGENATAISLPALK